MTARSNLLADLVQNFDLIKGLSCVNLTKSQPELQYPFRRLTECLPDLVSVRRH